MSPDIPSFRFVETVEEVTEENVTRDIEEEILKDAGVSDYLFPASLNCLALATTSG